LNAARGRQVSEQIWSALNKRREQDWVQQQFQALQARLQAVQLENMRLQQENVRLRQDNAEYERLPIGQWTRSRAWTGSSTIYEASWAYRRWGCAASSIRAQHSIRLLLPTCRFSLK